MLVYDVTGTFRNIGNWLREEIDMCRDFVSRDVLHLSGYNCNSLYVITVPSTFLTWLANPHTTVGG